MIYLTISILNSNYITSISNLCHFLHGVILVYFYTISQQNTMDNKERQYIIKSDTSSLYTVSQYSKDYLSDLMLLPYRCHPDIIVYGKQCTQNRDILFISDVSSGYRYSGTKEPSVPFNDYSWIRDIMDNLNNDLKTEFNSVLINRYNNGDDYVGSHADETNVLSNGIVACLSYGDERTFRVRDKKTAKIVVDVPTEHCSLLVMDGNFQDEYRHEIVKTKKRKSERISLTFRKHIKDM